jgi:hypothetical protein
MTRQRFRNFGFMGACGEAVACIVPAMMPATPAMAEELRLQFLLACEIGQSCIIQNYVDVDPSVGASDYRCGTRTYDAHDGTDFRLPTREAQRAGVNVLAAAAGRVLRVRDGMEDVPLRKDDRERVRNQECGNGMLIAHADKWQTQYCHMAKGSLQVKPGDVVAVGQVLGQVGLSGLTEYPHLHFTLRHDGKVADPFAYGKAEGACEGGENMWDPAWQAKLSYQERVVVNFGFATGDVTGDAIDDGEVARNPPSADAPALVAYIRIAGLKIDDLQSLTLFDPSGHALVDHRVPPLDRNKAQYFFSARLKRPADGWPRGTYTATYMVRHAGVSVFEKTTAVEVR